MSAELLSMAIALGMHNLSDLQNLERSTGRNYTLLIFIVLVMGGCTLPTVSRFYWDARIASLCKEDGNIVAYEQVPVGQTEMEEAFFYSGRLSKTTNTPYRYAREKIILNRWFSTVTKYSTTFYRTSTGKLIGKVVSYHRVGGDFPLIGDNPSTYSCRDVVPRKEIEERAFFVPGPYQKELE